MTPDDKIALFLNYFRCRWDVYSRLWINNRTGKRGYSPACKNEWVQNICKKPAIKCSECPNQQFFPFDEVAVKQHLSGRQVIGVYPMLQNENCCFLAMDFDKEHWRDDVCAVMAVAAKAGSLRPLKDRVPEQAGTSGFSLAKKSRRYWRESWGAP